MLIPRLDILPPPQRALWDELVEIPPAFVLYGGTGLALRLGHRQSEDFDFFSNESFRPDELERRISFLQGSQRLQSSPDTLVSLIDRNGPVKVSFFGGLSLRRVQDPEIAEGIGLKVASLLDLAATKVKVVQDRAETKDYIDVSRILAEGMDLAKALGAASAVYGSVFNPLLSLKALSYFADGDLRSLPESVRSSLTTAVDENRSERDPRNPALSWRDCTVTDLEQVAVASLLVEDPCRSSSGFQSFPRAGDDLRHDRRSRGGSPSLLGKRFPGGAGESSGGRI